MKPKWLISSNCFDDGNPEKMMDAALAQGCEVNWFKYIPFEHDKNQKLGFEKKHDCVVSYGSIQLCKLVERATSWTPGCWTPWEALKCSHYLTHWGEYSLHTNFAFVTLGDLRRRWNQLYNYFAIERTLFIKPDGNEKAFHGELVYQDQYQEWWKFAKCYDPADEMMCLISMPKKIQREWRCVVANKKFVTGSQYRELVDGRSSVEIKPDCPEDVQKYVEMVAQSGTFDPAPMYCMDIGETQGGLKVVEIGGVNCAGLYDCDMAKIVEAANVIAAAEFEAVS